MSSRGRLWALIGCLFVTVAILSLAILPSGSSASFLGATTHTGANGFACGSVGPDPTRAEVERFAPRLYSSTGDTAKLVDCFGFTADPN